MGANSKIEWCHHTHNFWVGCEKVSQACKYCYAEGWARRTGSPELWRGSRRRTTAENWRQPLRWNRQAAAAGANRYVFANSLSDFFDAAVPPAWRDDAWDVIKKTLSLTWMLLTKRPQNIRDMLPADWGCGWPNVWLGTTVEHQEEADRRIPHLLGVPFFFKQWGEWLPTDQPGAGKHRGNGWCYINHDGYECHGLDATAVMHRVGKRRAGAMLDGREWREMPT